MLQSIKDGIILNSIVTECITIECRAVKTIKQFTIMLKYDEINNLIGKEVTAIGNCGMGLDKKVSGILEKDNYDYYVKVTKPNGFIQTYSVSFQTIKAKI